MYKIIYSDVYSGIYNLNNSSIDIAITSPPYWGQRDYGFEGQIGNESTYNEYVGKLVAIYNLMKEKMSEKGIFFLNIGDKYLSKYGKSPLGLIPYKLAYFMVKAGWFLNDIIIWYKPNHMPSSVKNRFTNSYEPVFVLSKNEKNIFTEYKENDKNYSNILKINLQQSQYKHVATYPENLVSSLLNMVTYNDNSTVLDMFAGSGTTLKAVKDMNESILSYKKLNAIMIENNQEYIEIIKERCDLKNIEIIKYDFMKYDYKTETDDFFKLGFFTEHNFNVSINKNGFIKIFNKKNEFYNFISNFLKSDFKKKLDLNATCLLGVKKFDIDLIYYVSILNQKGWIIRNLLVVEQDNKWFPIFMIIDDNKKEDNIFNYKNLDLKHKTIETRDWSKIDYIGYKVVNNLSKNKITGIIVKILDKYENGFPKFIIVKWSNDTFSKEFVIFSQEEINDNLKIIREDDNLIYIFEQEDIISLNNDYENTVDLSNISARRNYIKNYNGKFKEEKRINWGASPGARASNEEEYFSKQRLYEVDQKIIADYLNKKRIEKKLSKKQLIDLFPKNYFHTVGHWLRKDFGGSVPLPEDWKLLEELLKIEPQWTNYVCKTALKLQAVKQGEYKLPDDFIDGDLLDKIEILIKI